jgi:hypothetical protein
LLSYDKQALVNMIKALVTRDQGGADTIFALNKVGDNEHMAKTIWRGLALFLFAVNARKTFDTVNHGRTST